MPEQTVSLHEGSVAVVPQKAEKKSGKRIGFNYIILKSLKESKKNDVVKCIYIKGITSFGLCVIKEGSQGDTKDANGRDIQDRLKWQRILHERLAGKVRIPKYIDSFEENGNYYLVIEHIKGESFYQIVKRDHNLRQNLLEGGTAGRNMISYTEQAVELLQELHRHNIIHRDVTLANFMVMPNGKVAVIDLELSYSLDEQYPLPPFALGTHGYMSPEQEAISRPSVKQDIFSIGAVILHIWTGISPMKFVKMPEEHYRRAIDFFVEDKAIANLIVQCTKQEAELRPDTVIILQFLKEYKQTLNNKEVRKIEKKKLFIAQEISETIQKGIAGLSEPLMRDKEKGWFADHLTEKKESISDIRRTWYASFNRGVSGILYFLSRAHGIGYDVSSAAVPVQQSLNLIRMKYLNNRVEPVKAGYHFGADGIAMCLGEVYRNGWMNAEDAMMADWAYLLSGDTKTINLSEGKAGQGIAHLHCAGLVSGTREKHFADELIGRQLPGGNWLLSKKRQLMHIEYGQSGIIYFLLQYGIINSNKEALKSAIRGLEYMIDNAVIAGDTVRWRKKQRALVDSRRCEGNPGIALTFLKAYEATGDLVYRKWAERALTGHDESKLWASLSMCHGIAGLGETYLEAAHLLGDERWLEKATNCVQILTHMQQVTKNGNAFWYVERERHPVANLFVGNAGILHFLLRYLNQGRFGFPGMI